ncbi:MAG: hypothetical protein KF727_00135 [Microbacteriaceae bacterium]|nr:hypothetical protein [Microbacteriaceae bacterium]
MRRAAIVAGVAVLGALLAGCAGSGAGELPDPYLTAVPGEHGPGTPPAGEGVYPIVPATHAHVQLWCPLVSAVHYDAEAIPADTVEGAFVCTTAPWDDAPDGTAQIEEFVDRVDADDVPGLLEAYAVPDAEPTDGMCTLELRDPLIVWLHHADQRITPVYAPRDECGKPTPEATAVYEGLDLHRLLVAREKLTP